MFATILEKIYNSEINCRFEWFWDGGFTWSIMNNEVFPRILKDGDLEEVLKNTIRSKKYSKEMRNPIYEKDWIARGTSNNIKDAIYDLTDAIEKHFPNSGFTKWVQDYNKNMEHFYICSGCGDLVDMRDLNNVFEHEHNNENIPIIDKDIKYIAKREGDNKAWYDGKEIDLN
jgi:hypothetical protein